MVFDTSTATDNDLAAATFVNLTFATQENGVRGEKIGHGDTGDPYYAPRRPCAGASCTPDNTTPEPTNLSPDSNHPEATG